MLWREVDGLVITQPNHAWLAGQLARAWGNDRFAAPGAAEAVCLAAEQHDLGWHEWERSPTLNLETGKPHFFREMAVSDHIALWRSGVDMAMALGRYPALLISLHASGLYAQFDPGRAAAEEVAGVRDFLADQERVRQRLLVRLAGDPAYRDASSPETAARHRALIALTDRLSIAICSGVVAPTTVVAPGLSGILLSPIDGDPRRLLVDPWPFRDQTVQLIGEGRALPGRYEDEATMRADLDVAASITILMELFPTRLA
jgi:hypothetical protein